MSLSIVYSRAKVGIDAPLVTVEVHLSNGLPGLSMVGLPETAVKESKDRVRSAIINSGFEFPARRVTINLAPADLPKEGGRYDLAIALGVLHASGQLVCETLDEYEFLGELALTGELRGVHGVLPAALATGNVGRKLIVAQGNCEEVSLCQKTTTYPANTLLELCNALVSGRLPDPVKARAISGTPTVSKDLRDVKGQYQARRALEIAAAGSHNLLFYGPPGTGKSMLASRLPGILPPMIEGEALEVASIYSISGKPIDHSAWAVRPFRTPHHTASAAALVGGGGSPKPGEISLAHKGVLFLDELPEFNRKVLEVLREPIESGHIVISRAASQMTFPSQFQLLAAMNPCPCGYKGHPSIPCSDSQTQIDRYRQKISGPMLDRFDMHVEVPAQSGDVLIAGREVPESSESVRKRVMTAHERQLSRQSVVNQQLEGRELERVCFLEEASRQLLETALNRLGLSARAYHRVLRVARTIADLEGERKVEVRHLTEAIAYRKLDRRPEQGR